MDKILNIYSIVNNRLDLLELQYFSFKTFFKTPFVFHIVDNSQNLELQKQFKNYAKTHNLVYINTNSTDQRGPGYKHAECLNYIWKNYIVKNIENFAMICDSDIFAVQPTTVENILENFYWAAAPMQHRLKKYFWLGPTVAFFDLSKLPSPETINWDAGFYVDGVGLDTGGRSYEYLINNINVPPKVKNLKATHHINDENKNKHCLPETYIDSYKDEYSLEFFSNYFLHYARGSNWDNASPTYHQEKVNYVSKLLSDLALNKVQAVNHNFLIENNYYGKWPHSDRE